MIFIAGFQERGDREGGHRAIRVGDERVKLALAQGDETGLLGRDLIDDTEGGEFVDGLAHVLGELDQDLESYLDLDDSAEDFKKLADALSSFKLDSLVLFWQA